MEHHLGIAGPAPRKPLPTWSVLTRRLAKAAGAAWPMLLIGAAGSGKAALAWTVHSHSPRRDQPFLMIPCGGLTATGLETAFAQFVCGPAAHNGACRAGTLAGTQPGTVFLNDIDTLDSGWQAALLQYVEGPGESANGVRLIGGCATELADAVELGRFRQDLYYRLSVMTIRMSPASAGVRRLPD